MYLYIYNYIIKVDKITKFYNEFVQYSISIFYDKSYWRKCRMMAFRFLLILEGLLIPHEIILIRCS